MAGKTLELPPVGYSHHPAVITAATRVLDHVAAEWGTDLLEGESVDEREAWFYFEKVSEVSNLVGGSAGMLAQCTFYIGVIEPNGDEIPAVDPVTGKVLAGLDAAAVAAAQDTLERYTDAGGSRRAIVAAQAECWGVSGDGYLIGYRVDSAGKPVEETDPTAVAEEFKFVARGALARKEGGAGYRLQETRDRAVDLPTTTLVRQMTRSHPRFPGEGKGWVKNTLEACRDLYFFTLAQRAAAKSNLPADVWIVPAEATPKDLTAAGWGPGAEGALGDGAPQTDDGKQSFAAYLEEVLGKYVRAAMKEASGGRGVTPAFLSIEERLVKSFDKLSFQRDIDPQLKEAIDQARTRIAESADASPEMLKGLGDSNRWNGEQVTKDEYRRYLKPVADAMGDAWTFAVLHHEMRARNVAEQNYRRLRVLVDASAIVVPADKAGPASEGVRLGAVGLRYWREANGIPETAAPTEADLEIMERMGLNRSSEHGSEGKGRGDQGAPEGSPAVDDTKGSSLPALTAAATPADELSTKLLRIEQTALSRLEEAAEAALASATKTAGAKLKNWAKAAKLDSSLPVSVAVTPAEQVPGLLGPAKSLELVMAKHGDDTDARREDLFAAAMIVLLAAFERIVRQAYRQAEAAYGGKIPGEEIDANVERAKTALEVGMLLVAERELLGIGEAPQDEGETVAGMKVPVSVLRAALAIAGGAYIAMSLRPDSAIGEMPVIDGTETTASLVFGPALARIAPETEGMRWAYGDDYRTDPFEPHLLLDGKQFATRTDPVLAGSPFTTFGGFYCPGDHDGCRCQAVPVHRVGSAT